MEHELYHYGVLGMRWGVRKAKRQAARIQRKDVKWANRNYNRIYKNAYKDIRSEMNAYTRNELNPKYREQIQRRKVGLSYANEYNRKLAQLMNTRVSDIRAPSGKVVQFIAKRGELGVHMALADAGYDMSQVKNGVYKNGKIAYRKKSVDIAG
jgi:hypothetical protein